MFRCENSRVFYVVTGFFFVFCFIVPRTSTVSICLIRHEACSPSHLCLPNSSLTWLCACPDAASGCTDYCECCISIWRGVLGKGLSVSLVNSVKFFLPVL